MFSDKWIRRAALLALLLIGAWPVIADAPSREYQLKAAFIYNFAQFIDWPDRAFAKADSPFVITVLGENPFGNVLDQVTKGKVIKGREISVRYVQNAGGVGQTHILFVAPPHNQNPAELLRNHPGVLTIADTDNFMAAGGIVRFFVAEDKLRFEINPEAAEKAGLKISAKVLQLAKVYKGN